jgi:hypothetical protein
MKRSMSATLADVIEHERLRVKDGVTVNLDSQKAFGDMDTELNFIISCLTRELASKSSPQFFADEDVQQRNQCSMGSTIEEASQSNSDVQLLHAKVMRVYSNCQQSHPLESRSYCLPLQSLPRILLFVSQWDRYLSSQQWFGLVSGRLSRCFTYSSPRSRRRACWTPSQI